MIFCSELVGEFLPAYLVLRITLGTIKKLCTQYFYRNAHFLALHRCQ